MNNKPVSFFDDEEYKASFTLWSKERAPVSALIQGSAYRCVLLKHSKKSNKYKERFFVLLHNRLYCARKVDSGKTMGYLNLQFSTCLFEKEVVDNQTFFCIKVVRNGRCVKLLAKDKETVKAFRTAVKPHIIQTNFHAEYEAKKIINCDILHINVIFCFT